MKKILLVAAILLTVLPGFINEARAQRVHVSIGLPGVPPPPFVVVENGYYNRPYYRHHYRPQYYPRYYYERPYYGYHHRGYYYQHPRRHGHGYRHHRYHGHRR